MLKPIAVIQKKDRFGLGYNPDRQGRQRFVEEKSEKRIVSFLEKEKESAKMEIPSLSYTFRSVGFINLDAIQRKDKKMLTDVDEVFESLSIDMVEVKESKAWGIRLPLFPRRQILDNWTTVEVSVVFRFQNE